jgi:hypothetical protein
MRGKLREKKNKYKRSIYVSFVEVYIHGGRLIKIKGRKVARVDRQIHGSEQAHNNPRTDAYVSGAIHR